MGVNSHALFGKVRSLEVRTDELLDTVQSIVLFLFASEGLEHLLSSSGTPSCCTSPHISLREIRGRVPPIPRGRHAIHSEPRRLAFPRYPWSLIPQIDAVQALCAWRGRSAPPAPGAGWVRPTARCRFPGYGATAPRAA